jgi:Ca2+:H+ antiporter
MTKSHRKGFPTQIPFIYWLLLLVPASFALHRAYGIGVTTFSMAILALIPLSVIMGDATEQLSLRFGPLVGGLMNATFGNATELVIGYVGLRAGLLVMVRASLIGSIIGELLLVLGMGAVAGGIRKREQVFGQPTGSLMSTLMLLAVIGLVVPAVCETSGSQGQPQPHPLSVIVSCILLVTYVLGLVFTLKTHQSLFNQPSPDEEPVARWSWQYATLLLVICTAFVVAESELVVGSVEPTARALGWSQVFIGVIVIAIVGNAAEHSSAVLMAYRDRMDICVNVALGSSAQVALLVAPLLVLMSARFQHPLDLVFSPFEIVAVILSVAVAHFVALDGKTNWFEGAELLAVYLILATGFYFMPA